HGSSARDGGAQRLAPQQEADPHTARAMFHLARYGLSPRHSCESGGRTSPRHETGSRGGSVLAVYPSSASILCWSGCLYDILAQPKARSFAYVHNLTQAQQRQKGL